MGCLTSTPSKDLDLESEPLLIKARTYKIIVLGAGGVGKSALTIRLVTDKFLEEYDPTIEDYYRKPDEINGAEIVYELLDTAGQEEFAFMQDRWIRETEAILFVCDITMISTFEEIENLYEKVKRIKEDELINMSFVVVGNKCDLEELREVKKEEGEKLIKEC